MILVIVNMVTSVSKDILTKSIMMKTAMETKGIPILANLAKGVNITEIIYVSMLMLPPQMIKKQMTLN